VSEVWQIMTDGLYQLTMQLPDGTHHVVGSLREALPLASQCDPLLLQQRLLQNQEEQEQRQQQQQQQQWSGAGLLSPDAADRIGLGGISGSSSDGWSSSSSSSNDVTSSNSSSKGGWRWSSKQPALVPLAAALTRAERVADGLVPCGAAFLSRGHVVRLCSMTGGWRVPLKSCVAHPCMPAGAWVVEIGWIRTGSWGGWAGARAGGWRSGGGVLLESCVVHRCMPADGGGGGIRCG
jgi:hypothetical protein